MKGRSSQIILFYKMAKPYPDSFFSLLCSVCEKIIEQIGDRCLADRNEDDQTGLHLAASQGHFEVVKLLLTKGAKVDET